MTFLSASFAFFGIALFAGWWALPGKARPWLLACANLIFAGLFGAQTLFFLLLITLISYGCGLWLKHRKSRLALWVGILACLAPLAAYKYLPLAAEHFPSFAVFRGLLAPVGISFYVFKSISYLADLYKGRIEAESCPLCYFNYVGFFAQIASGPIQRANSLLPQFKNPALRFDRTLAFTSCVRLCWGLFLKKCLADQFAGFQGALYRPEHYYGLSIVWAMIAYSLYIYFDFASYSQLSIGVANLLGIRVEENFISPYFSRSIGEFWRRWHISLSSFLRDYIYIPLGGSRNGVPVLIFATMVTFILSGAWHGATDGFLLWGALNGIYLLMGRLTRPVRERIWGALHQSEHSPLRCVIGCGFTFLLVTIGWFFFMNATLAQAGHIADYLFRPAALSVQYIKESLTQLGYTPILLVRLGLFTLLAAAIDWLSRKDGFGSWAQRQKPWLLTILCYVCIFATLFYGSSGTLQNVYFKF